MKVRLVAWTRRHAFGRPGVILGITLALAAPSLHRAEVGAAEPEGRIVVLDEASSDGEMIRLADVAQLEGPAAEALAGLEIGRAPTPGRMRTVSGETILGALRRHGVDFERVRYVIPPVVHVQRHAQEVAASAIRDIVHDYLGGQIDRAGGHVAVHGVEVPGPVLLAPGPYRSRVTRQRESPLAGRTQLMVEFLQADRVVSAVPVTAQIAVFEDIYVTRHAVPAGTVVTAEDVLTERRDVSTLPRGMITRAADAVGKETKMALPPLTPLRHEQLGTPALVRRGEVVTLVAESGALVITTTGEVRENAARGDQVHVLNQSSGAEVVGRVVDERTVAVAF